MNTIKQAMTQLADILGRGPVPCDTVRTIMKASGFTRGDLTRARRGLSTKLVRVPDMFGGAVEAWALPGQKARPSDARKRN